MKIKLLSSVFIFSLFFISCSSDDDGGEQEKEEAVVTLKSTADISFSLDDSNRFYASSTNEMYGEGNIDADAVKVIDIVGDSNTAFIAFSSPSETEDFITNGSVTKIQTQNVSMTVAEFDAMEDDTTLKALTVVGDNEAIGLEGYKDRIVIFENAAGKKGAIKLKAINATRLLVDIKVQM
ncbi:hypothetical protein ACE939_08095 [Aquimarina sp. W85]|uniref:hypothetical protein n=1 Tax=Aquimarina rhodophyticola TaxID=3342246 RepID=UPI00367027D7